jgi:hypothetical protein
MNRETKTARDNFLKVSAAKAVPDDNTGPGPPSFFAG